LAFHLVLTIYWRFTYY